MTDIAGLRERAGTHVGYTDWQEMTQERVNQFADATDDHQFIHVDVERAKQTPFGGTIAHGFLTLSLVAPVSQQLMQVSDAVMGLNYGLDRVRFPAPLPVGARWRGGMEILEVTEIPGGLQVKSRITIEVKDSEKPACVADSLVRVYGGGSAPSGIRAHVRASTSKSSPRSTFTFTPSATTPSRRTRSRPRCWRPRRGTSGEARRSRARGRSPITTASGTWSRSCSTSTTRPGWAASASATARCSRRRAPIRTC